MHRRRQGHTQAQACPWRFFSLFLFWSLFSSVAVWPVTMDSPLFFFSLRAYRDPSRPRVPCRKETALADHVRKRIEEKECVSIGFYFLICDMVRRAGSAHNGKF